MGNEEALNEKKRERESFIQCTNASMSCNSAVPI